MPRLTYDSDPDLEEKLRSVDQHGELDAAHDAFVELKTKDREPHIGVWVILARYRGLDQRRRERRRRTQPIHDYGESLQASSPSPDTLAIKADDGEQVRSKVEDLPPKYRHVVRLYFFEDASVQEIATDLKISEKAVYSRLRRACEKLGRQLSKLLRS